MIKTTAVPISATNTRLRSAPTPRPSVSHSASASAVSASRPPARAAAMAISCTDVGMRAILGVARCFPATISARAVHYFTPTCSAGAPQRVVHLVGTDP
ncbi:hypothetical protein AB1935_006974 [Pseudomonas aeruginosa]|nr:hypothetical protein [Pseudomonas aeruginosa]